MQSADLIIKNAYIITMDKSRRILRDAGIAIKGDRIVEVSGSDEITAKYSAGKIIDAGGKYVFPGFISTHTHLFQVLLKGLGRDKALIDWLNSSVRRAIFKLDKECCYYAALAGCIESIRTGMTTTLDYMYPHGLDDLDSSVLQAFDEIGIRGVLGRGHTKTDEFPKEYACIRNETEDMFFQDVERLVREYKGHSRISIAIAPAIVWDLSDEGFVNTRKLADKLGIPITMHVVETEDDNAYTLEAKGMKTIPFLEKMGMLGPDFIGVHCVHMEEEDIALFKKYDVKVSHNPVSNMILASGIAPVPRFMEEGIVVSLAVDGAASNDTQDMLETLKTTALQHKVHTRNAAVVTASEVVEMATLGGARALLMEKDIGSIEAGKKADLFIYNPVNARSIPVLDPVSSIVYSSGQANVETSVIGGKVVLENGKMTTVDEEKILYMTQKTAEKLTKETGLGNTQWGQEIRPVELR